MKERTDSACHFRHSNTREAAGRIYDAQKVVENLPAAPAEALASLLQQSVDLIQDSTDELQSQVVVCF